MGSCVPGRDIPRYINLYKNGKLPIEKLLGEKVELEGLNDAFDRLDSGESLRQILFF